MRERESPQLSLTGPVVDELGGRGMQAVLDQLDLAR